MSERASRYFCFKNNKGVCPSLLSGIFFLFKSRGVRVRACLQVFSFYCFIF
jgi:hypothetical protein